MRVRGEIASGRLVLGALLGGSLLGGGCASGAKAAADHEAPAARVEAATDAVRAEALPETYVATGTIRAQLNAVLAAKTTSRVEAVSVVEGDVVEYGTPLVRLDSRELSAAMDVAAANVSAAEVAAKNATRAIQLEARTADAAIAQAEAQLRQAKAAEGRARADLDLAKAGPRPQERNQASLAVRQAESARKLASTEFARTRTLVEQGALPGRQLDVAQTALEAAIAQHETAIEAERIAQEGTRTETLRAAQEAKARVAQAEAGLRSARAASLGVSIRQGEAQAAKASVAQGRANLRLARATLSYASLASPFRGKIVRRWVDPGALATPGSPLLEMEGGAYRLEATVPERHVGRLRVGQRLPVSLDARPDAGPLATGRVVEIGPQGDRRSLTFLVRIELAPGMDVRSGMFGRAHLPIGERRSLTIPGPATWREDGADYVCVVGSEGVAERRLVTLGRVSGRRVEVLSGLRSGERVVIERPASVPEGAKVATKEPR